MWQALGITSPHPPLRGEENPNRALFLQIGRPSGAPDRDGAWRELEDGEARSLSVGNGKISVHPPQKATARRLGSLRHSRFGNLRYAFGESEFRICVREQKEQRGPEKWLMTGAFGHWPALGITTPHPLSLSPLRGEGNPNRAPFLQIGRPYGAPNGDGAWRKAKDGGEKARPSPFHEPRVGNMRAGRAKPWQAGLATGDTAGLATCAKPSETERFMVPMRGRKAVEALHEPPVGKTRGNWPIPASPPHSNPLTRWGRGDRSGHSGNVWVQGFDARIFWGKSLPQERGKGFPRLDDGARRVRARACRFGNLRYTFGESGSGAQCACATTFTAG